MADDEYLDTTAPDSIVLGLMGRVNYAWAQLDLISTAAFASLLNLDPVELGMAIGRIGDSRRLHGKDT